MSFILSKTGSNSTTPQMQIHQIRDTISTEGAKEYSLEEVAPIRD